MEMRGVSRTAVAVAGSAAVLEVLRCWRVHRRAPIHQPIWRDLTLEGRRLSSSCGCPKGNMGLSGALVTGASQAVYSGQALISQGKPGWSAGLLNGRSRFNYPDSDSVLVQQLGRGVPHPASRQRPDHGRAGKVKIASAREPGGGCLVCSALLCPDLAALFAFLLFCLTLLAAVFYLQVGRDKAPLIAYDRGDRRA
ncbi:hypothetical protein TEQG_01094 [Trichophyton equinum CBS 127.97]|uniref:Uncharacterized protein n=1 Tax=Trichophyton equinum (strain ATCC MYA-4606 / CBS 127.97) TaxID=559882 RepID=F2PJI7_TRIEC|nr:hypothetical protein TEQG_01094 [Trichophyton equinum CBS 127.97]